MSLPFLWPFCRSVKRGYEDSAEAMKERIERVKEVDVDRCVKPLRKQWKAGRSSWRTLGNGGRLRPLSRASQGASTTPTHPRTGVTDPGYRVAAEKVSSAME